MFRNGVQIHAHIRTVMAETGQDDPASAVRTKARALVQDFHSLFDSRPPFNLEVLASWRGLRISDDAPRLSNDSEIAPEADGRVVLRLNRDRPRTRQRFSIGHEIGHTLFPEYQVSVRCRKVITRPRADPEDLLETLCDIAASEFMFPEPWFTARICSLTLSGAALARLANEYEASREATVRRFVELHDEPLAAVFFGWKLKPTEIRRQRRDSRQRRMFADESLYPEPAKKLRVDYAVVNDAFEKCCTDHIPKDKSIPSEGVVFEASTGQVVKDGQMHLDLGTVQRTFQIHAIPIHTPEIALGPANSVSVVAVIRPSL